MSEKKRIACFFTAGYTELNAMKSFMGKINDRVEYIQLCPTGPRKSKAAIKNRDRGTIDIKQNGMTGEQLIKTIEEFIGTNRFAEEGYDAILIEDDKDGRFLSEQEDGTAKIDEEKWEIFKQNVIERLRKKRPNIPIIFFYAAPEVEAWFLADWKNSFGSVYKDTFDAKQNDYFSIKFRKYVNDKILTARYVDCIEEYGYFDKTYRKLSEQIQTALEMPDFWENWEKYGPKTEHPTVSYSKKREGAVMLKHIDPQEVLHNCSFYFKEGYQALHAL